MFSSFLPARGLLWSRRFLPLALLLGACGDEPAPQLQGQGPDRVLMSTFALVGDDVCPLGFNVITGTSGDDQLNGTEGADCILGLGGNDTIHGLGGADVLKGGDGYDTISGGPGNDWIHGGEQNDTLSGGPGNDQLFGSLDNDTLLGEAGEDSLEGDEGDDALSGGDGADLLTGGPGVDALDGDGCHDRLVSDASDTWLNPGWPGFDVCAAGSCAQTPEQATLCSSDADCASGTRCVPVVQFCVPESADFCDGVFTDSFLDQACPVGSNLIVGTEGDDYIEGTAGVDCIRGLGGDDVLHGLGGNDLLLGGFGNDLLNGGDGDDELEGGHGNDSLSGGAGDDYLHDVLGHELMYGELGNDRLLGGRGSDSLYGGAGADWLDGEVGEDKLEGQECHDRLIFDPADAWATPGSPGVDACADGGCVLPVTTPVCYSDSECGTNQRCTPVSQFCVSLAEELCDGVMPPLFLDVVCPAGTNEIIGTEGNDVLEGTDGPDCIRGLGGDDTLRGYGGNDLLQGGLGWDTLEGGSGNDELEGGHGNDILYGEQGDDVLHDAAGNDRLYGGAGNDRLLAGSGEDYLYGGPGADFLEGGADRDSSDGQECHDRIGWDSDDNYAVPGWPGLDVCDGGQCQYTPDEKPLCSADADCGPDMRCVPVARFCLPVFEDLCDAMSDVDFSDAPCPDGMNVIVGTEGNDELEGTPGADCIRGLGGDDILRGLGGDDLLQGGPGNDTLEGGDGDDELAGGQDDDSLGGGAGDDYLHDSYGWDWLRGETGSDRLYGGPGNDLLQGGDGGDFLDGGPGRDRLHGNTCHDRLISDGYDQELVGGGGLDVCDNPELCTFNAQQKPACTDDDECAEGERCTPVSQTCVSLEDEMCDVPGELYAPDLPCPPGSNLILGTSAGELLEGTPGPDCIRGLGGDDTLRGLGGDDVLQGGDGYDTLEGGEGNDRLAGGHGNDSLHGGPGDDDLSDAFGWDILTGDEGNDRLSAGPGDDMLNGGEGSDLLNPGSGSDRTFGGPCHDRIYSSAEDVHTIGGEPGQDVCEAGDCLYLNAEKPVCSSNADCPAETRCTPVSQFCVPLEADFCDGATLPQFEDLECPPGYNLIIGTNGDDELIGTDGSDCIRGLHGNDVIRGLGGDDLLQGGFNDDWIEGGEGRDRIEGGGGSDRLFGGPGDDVITDIYGWDWLYGEAGNDRLEGGPGNDALTGGEGADYLDPGPGSDTADGSQCHDRLVYQPDDQYAFPGGPGVDVCDGGQCTWTPAEKPLCSSDAACSADTRCLPVAQFCVPRSEDSCDASTSPLEDVACPSGMNVILGTEGPDVLEGTDGPDCIRGLGGDDLIRGLGGDDLLQGGYGNDVLEGGAGDDELAGGPNDDQLSGGTGEDSLHDVLGNDTLSGGAGDDELSGGPGDDQLTGEAGADLLNGGEGADSLSGGDCHDVLTSDGDDSWVDGEGGVDVCTAGSCELHPLATVSCSQNAQCGSDERCMLAGSFCIASAAERCERGVATADDTDGDFVANTLDNCPALFNPDQQDSDADRLGDLCDNCPAVANPRQEPSVPASAFGAACSSPVQPYCGDGVVQSAAGEQCDEGVNNADSAACGRTCLSNLPVITTQPQARSVVEGLPFSFEVVASGALLYQWRRDGVAISGATSASYGLASAQLSDSGAAFSCLVSNAAGAIVSQPATLTVTLAAPTVAVQPESQSVLENSAVTFVVQANGSQLSYQWRRNGSDIVGATSASLTLGNVTVADHNASFAVVISNAAGSVTSSVATLQVGLRVPVISEQPQSQTVAEGGSASFSCAATGNALSYSWTRNGVVIAGAGTASYSTGAISYADNGVQFRCIASNAAGSATSSPASLTVTIQPPVFQAQPSGQTVLVGSSASFSATVTGTQVSYQWLQNGSPIAGATGSSFSTPALAKLDSGTVYRLRAYNPAGETLSTAVNVTVVDCLEASYVPQPTSCGVGSCAATGERRCVAGEIRDTCSAGNAGDEACNGVDDDCDGTVDELGPRCAGSSVETCSGGSWVSAACGDQNQCNGTESCSAGACVAGSAPTLDDGNPCTADSCSPAQGVQHTPISAGSACGPGASCDGSGACVVTPGPVIVSQPVSRTGSVGGQVTFSVTASGAGLSYQWLRAGEAIAGATAASYTRTALTMADHGIAFSVRIQNGGGTVTSQPATLSVTPVQTGPVVTIFGANPRTVAADYVLITGTATAANHAATSLTVSSDRYAGQTFGGLMSEDGSFSAEVPLALGDNLLTVQATGATGSSGSAQLLVTSASSLLPRVQLTAPADGSTTTEAHTQVSGVIRSSLPAETIRLVLGSQVTFPSGSNGQYTFSFDNVPLLVGSNILTVRAETIHGNTLGQTSVTRTDGSSTGPSAPTPPRISVQATGAEVYVPGPQVPVSGTVVARRCVSQVTVNGSVAQLTGVDATVSFSALLAFAPGVNELPITVLARDCDNVTATLSYTARRDLVAPVLSLDNLQLAPASNPASQTPFPVSGTISEQNLAGLSANDQSIGVLPTGTGSFSFRFDVPLVHGPAQPVRIEAWDISGNRTSATINLELAGNLEIEVVSPSAGASFMANGDTGTLDVLARVPGIAPGDRLMARIDGGSPVQLTLNGDIAGGSLSVSAGEHTLLVSLETSAGASLGSRAVPFKVVDKTTIPLAIVGSNPTNGQAGVEGNSVLTIYLSKAIADPLELSLQVKETVHGQVYRADGAGASVTPELVRVDRDQELVPGTMSVLRDNDGLTFKPSRELAFGASVDAEIFYDGQSIGKLRFQVRALPTLATGAVFAASGEPLAGAKVELVELGRSETTDDGGSFSFGFAETAGQDLPAGAYTLRVNGAGSLTGFGSAERRVRLEAGRYNSLSITRLPNLSPTVPARLVEAGATSVQFDGGKLVLDLTNATVTMPDGAPRGGVHIEPYRMIQLSVRTAPYLGPDWLYAAYPVGVAVNGNMVVDLALPMLDGSYAYLDAGQSRVVLLGVDPQSLELVPVGVGVLDKVARRLRSEGRTHFKRLDAIAYAPVGVELQNKLEQYGRGELSLDQLVREISMVAP